MEMFKQIGRNEVNGVISNPNPFWDAQFERMLTSTFPYLSFEYYVYRDAFLVRAARIGERLASAPFSDVGDIVPLGAGPLDLDQFMRDWRDHFGVSCPLRVHTGVCPVAGMPQESAVFDYRVALEDWDIMLRSLRKTLRHIVSSEPEFAVETLREKKELDDAYRLYLKHIRSVMNLAAPRALFEWAIDDPHHDLWVARASGRIRAFALFLNTGDASRYALSAADSYAKRHHAPHHLLAHAMRRSHAQGKKYMWLGPTRAGSALATFKEGWRGEPYPIITLDHDPERESARVSLARRLWRLVPLALLPLATKFAGKRFF